jgi:hypothetical protein
LGYDGERVDALALDQLEATLRHVADELAGWRARALKAEAEAKQVQSHGGGSASARLDPELRTRAADLEAENRVLRQRVEAARTRVSDLSTRLAFLEEQGRESAPAPGSNR